jgi:hypothetical protein
MKSSFHRLIPFLPSSSPAISIQSSSHSSTLYSLRSISAATAISGTGLTADWLSLSLVLLPTVSRPVCLGIKHPSGAYDQIFITVRQLRVCWCGALSVTRGRAFTITLGPRQRSAFRVRFPWDSWPYFTVSDLLRLAGLRWRYSTPPPHDQHPSLLIQLNSLL